MKLKQLEKLLLYQLKNYQFIIPDSPVSFQYTTSSKIKSKSFKVYLAIFMLLAKRYINIKNHHMYLTEKGADYWKARPMLANKLYLEYLGQIGLNSKVNPNEISKLKIEIKNDRSKVNILSNGTKSKAQQVKINQIIKHSKKCLNKILDDLGVKTDYVARDYMLYFEAKKDISNGLLVHLSEWHHQFYLDNKYLPKKVIDDIKFYYKYI